MSRFFQVLFLGALSLCLAAPSRAQDAAAYAISDDHSGLILESKNPAKKLQIGSLTKIATAMVVLDWSEARKRDLGELATVPGTAASLNSQGGLGLQAGDRCSLRDLLYAALMQSDNAAAQTLAEFVGRNLGSNEEPAVAFVNQMNALARKLGMAKTLFVNAHGGDDTERKLPYSTAEDLIKLTHYAEDRAGFRFYVSQKEKKITVERAAGESAGYMLRNTNELLGVEAIDGVKTGTTRRAGQCLIISAAKPPESKQQGETFHITPRRINVVVLNAQDRFAVAKALLERGWQLHASWSAAGRPEKWKGR
jgi:D-alanyl-D-alanine carboxypeptidase (penicillin-binding protein 5/6)